MSFILRVLVIGVCIVAISQVSGCGGGGGSTGGISTDTQSITGTVFAPNGTDPVAGATISVPSASASVSKSIGVSKAVTATCGSNTVTCSDPKSTASVKTCSCGDGTFSLDVSGLSSTDKSSATTLKIEKGDTSVSVTLACTSSTCTIAATDSKLPSSGTGALKIAVVTGAYDDIQDVLAKLGYGELDSTDNRLKLGTETFTIYRGGGSIDSELVSLDSAGTKYKEASALFGSADTMKTFDIIFINCGASESVTAGSESVALDTSKHLSHEAYHASKSVGKGSSIDSTVISNIQSYVNSGGKLYVTDLAYDFVEQSFPEVMDFQGGGDGSSTTAETAGAAELGDSGIVSDATVSNSTMKTWLSGRATNTIDSSSSPGILSCTTTTGGSSTALNTDGSTIRIGDFLSGWAVMKEAYDTNTTVWLTGPVTFSGSSGAETRALTVTRTIGSNSGEILYSSYHTSHSCPTSGFWPQERVLQYLVFEVAE